MATVVGAAIVFAARWTRRFDAMPYEPWLPPVADSDGPSEARHLPRLPLFAEPSNR